MILLVRLDCHIYYRRARRRSFIRIHFIGLLRRLISSTFLIRIVSISPSLGLTVGRVALLWVNKKVGERRVLFIYTILSIA